MPVMSSPSSSPDTVELISPRTRQVIYLVFAVASIIVGAIQAAYAGAEAPPEWLTVLTNVWLFLGGSQGILAFLKTPSSSSLVSDDAPVE